MRRPVLDVQVFDKGVLDFLDHKEVVRLVAATVRAFTVPVSRTISVNDVACGSSDGYSMISVSKVVISDMGLSQELQGIFPEV